MKDEPRFIAGLGAVGLEACRARRLVDHSSSWRERRSAIGAGGSLEGKSIT
ncbi:hypothetical protein FAM19031_001842 [Propionibacterium freudenreichii]|uniref:hypothetical protein n=1 Tax=Propionibacterium freudenreichii TaxID=1744 RepID=UPI00254B841E|nr:hypothetical protein [Propionibacterium freudenreichii]MDK9295675.1 hypothetical protein [Propionibacterium freudenreichii]MDK9361066.1 hypothetical protein [Propionibacterium freudenreichii]